jgi:hypothetical protein
MSATSATSTTSAASATSGPAPAASRACRGGRPRTGRLLTCLEGRFAEGLAKRILRGLHVSRDGWPLHVAVSATLRMPWAVPAATDVEAGRTQTWAAADSLVRGETRFRRFASVLLEPGQRVVDIEKQTPERVVRGAQSGRAVSREGFRGTRYVTARHGGHRPPSRRVPGTGCGAPAACARRARMRGGAAAAPRGLGRRLPARALSMACAGRVGHPPVRRGSGPIRRLAAVGRSIVRGWAPGTPRVRPRPGR